MPETRTDVLVDQRDPFGVPRRPGFVDDHLGVLTMLMSSAGDAAEYRSVDDRTLIGLAGIVAEQERVVSGTKALIGGELARRSAPELGVQGLARRTGHRSPEELLQVTTGSSLRDARLTVEVGVLALEAAALPDPTTGEIRAASTPWMNEVATAATSGSLSLEQARSIRKGLGKPRDGITPEVLTRAAATLRDEALDGVDADRLLIRAAELRDELDESGIAEREAERREARSFRLTRLPGGMTRAIWDMDDETAAVVTQIRDRAISPKLGGPRFVDLTARAKASAIELDPRTPVQLASDAFLQLVKIGAEADPSMLVGVAAPGVQVLVTARARAGRTGHARVEGSTTPISIDTAERIECTTGTVDITFDEHGHPLDVGRERRHFTRRQRVALAARDGGCMFGDCDRPPSWTEAHHINFWVRDRGETNIDVGILLCRGHHLLLHHNGWEIERRDTGFWLIPPASIDPERTPRRMRSKSAAFRDLMRESAAEA
jgi:hypothetical protein